MDMKKTWKWMLMAVVVLGLGMGVTACSDDDDDKKGGQTTEEMGADPYDKHGEAGTALMTLLSQLATVDSLPDNWRDATFEPSVGMALDASQPFVRTITVNSAAEAVIRYNSLTDKNLPASTKNDTYTVDGVGTLTLNVAGGGDVLATIDVNVKQLPKLTQLRLVTTSSIGENGSFKGEPYYHFGDIVKDKDGCHWICVRPAYSPDGKEDTHWMSFQLATSNIKEYTKKNRQKQTVPQDLGVQKEKMQYLAQLLAILADPDGYIKKVDNDGNYFNNSTTGLGGLAAAAMPADSLWYVARGYNMSNQQFWKTIAPSGISANDFKECFNHKDVTFVYSSYKTSGNNIQLPIVTYTGDFYVNAPTYATVTNSMDQEFNIQNTYTVNGKRGNPNYPLGDAFVVRYKTGKQLSSNWIFNPSATEALPGVEEVYRYANWRGTLFCFEAKDAQMGYVIDDHGHFYPNMQALRNGGFSAIAYVAYVGEEVNATKQSVEPRNYHGLAISLYDATTEPVVWGDKCDADCFKYGGLSTHLADGDDSDQVNYVDGMWNTTQLFTGCGKGHFHDAARAARNFDVTEITRPILGYGLYFTPTDYGFSKWFLPTAGQWWLFFNKHYCKMRTFEGGAFPRGKYSNLTEMLKNSGVDLKLASEASALYESYYWTSSGYQADSPVYVVFEEDEVYFTSKPITEKFTAKVRPWFAF